MAELKPLHDYVVLRPLMRAEKKSTGGIIMIEQEEAAIRAIVVAVGPGEMLFNGDLKSIPLAPGDMVLLDHGRAYRFGTGEDTTYLSKFEAVLAHVQLNEKELEALASTKKGLAESLMPDEVDASPASLAESPPA